MRAPCLPALSKDGDGQDELVHGPPTTRRRPTSKAGLHWRQSMKSDSDAATITSHTQHTSLCLPDMA